MVQGRRADALWIVLSGTVTLTKHIQEMGAQDEERLRLATLTAYDIFGEQVFTGIFPEAEDELPHGSAVPKHQNQSHAVASTAVRALCISREALAGFAWDSALMTRIKERAIKHPSDSKLIQMIRDKRKWLRDKQRTIETMSKKGELDLAAAERVGRGSK